MGRHSYTFQVADTEGQELWIANHVSDTTLESTIGGEFLNWLDRLPQDKILRDRASWHINQEF